MNESQESKTPIVSALDMAITSFNQNQHALQHHSNDTLQNNQTTSIENLETPKGKTVALNLDYSQDKAINLFDSNEETHLAQAS